MVTVFPNYLSIDFIRDVAEHWIELMGGDEWGDSASSLHSACHTDYGFSDEDCALFATKLIENIIYSVEQGDVWNYVEDASDVAAVQKKCAEAVEYWLNGGNLGPGWDKEKVVEKTLNSLPEWMFGGEIPE